MALEVIVGQTKQEVVEVLAGLPGSTSWGGIVDKPEVITKDKLFGASVAPSNGFLNLRTPESNAIIDLVCHSVTSSTRVIPPTTARTTRLVVMSGAENLVWPYPVHGTPATDRPNVFWVYSKRTTQNPNLKPLIVVEPVPSNTYEKYPTQTYTELAQAPSIAAATPDLAKTILGLHFKTPNLYVGYGDWTNNYGPVDIISLNVDTGVWTTHLSNFASEAIEKFVEIDGSIYVPAVDPVADNIGRFATNAGGTWVEKTIGHMIHVLDMAKIGGKIFAAGSAGDTPYTNEMGHGIVYESSDGGDTWTESLRIQNGGRIYNLAKMSMSGVIDLEMRVSAPGIGGQYVYRQEVLNGGGPWSWHWEPGIDYDTKNLRDYGGSIWKSPEVTLNYFGGDSYGENSHYPVSVARTFTSGATTHKPLMMSQWNNDVLGYESAIQDWVPSAVRPPTPPVGESISVITQIRDRIYYATNKGRIFRSDFVV